MDMTRLERDSQIRTTAMVVLTFIAVAASLYYLREVLLPFEITAVAPIASGQSLILPVGSEEAPASFSFGFGLAFTLLCFAGFAFAQQSCEPAACAGRACEGTA